MQRRRPHPRAERSVLGTWGFTCAGCGQWSDRMSWFHPTDEDGTGLYHYRCAPHPTKLWCRAGQHAVTTSCKPGAHVHPQLSTRRAVRCSHCARTFTPSRSDARYCSARCRAAAFRLRRR